MNPTLSRPSPPPFPPTAIAENLCNGGFGESALQSQRITPKQQCMSAAMDLQSSICVGTPTSILKPNGGDRLVKVAISGSSGEQSDDDDAEIKAGSCEQSADADDMRRTRRKDSNRESAKRSRKRRQAHQAELEWQVEVLNVEYSSLCKELTEAARQLRDASTNNRVLKSDVEALRAKVHLAEEWVAQGSMSCSFNNLFQGNNFSSSFPDPLGVLSPSFLVHGADNSRVLFADFSPQDPSIMTGSMDALNGDPTSSDLGTWDSIYVDQ